MRYFRLETSDPVVHLYPLVCWHLGCPQSDGEFIQKVVDQIAQDDYAKWIYMGDGGEVCTRGSKGDIFSQTLSPTEQQNEMVRLLAPVKAKGLFGIQGNHGNRVYKETGLDFDETLCAKLGIPYLGVSAFWHLKLSAGTEHPSLFSIYTHHGTDSGVTMASKVTKGQTFDRTFIADAILTAHSHVAIELPPRYYATLADTRTQDPERTIRWTPTHEYICGCAYDSRTGYAESKGYPPLLPMHLAIRFGPGKRQHCELIKPEMV